MTEFHIPPENNTTHSSDEESNSNVYSPQIPEAEADETPPLTSEQKEHFRQYAFLWGFTPEEITAYPLLVSEFGRYLIAHIGSNKNKIFAILSQPGIEEVVKNHADNPADLLYPLYWYFTPEEITAYPLLLSKFGRFLIAYTERNKEKVFAVLSQLGIEEVIEKHEDKPHILVDTLFAGFTAEDVLHYPHLVSDLVEKMTHPNIHPN